MADPVISAVTQVAAERVVDSVSNQLGYVWNYKTNFENLHRQHQKLKDTREAVQHRVDEAKGNGHEIEPQVVNWLDRVEEINAEVTKIIEDNNRANMRCFKSLCPDLKKRYQHSKEAARKTDVISELLQEGTFARVFYRTVPAETWHYDDYENIESRHSTLEGILNALRNPDVNMVGVYGMGGSGKTTLVREVARKAEEDMLFDKVVFVEVSASVDIARIQQEIAERLGLKFDEETVRVRADRLRDHIIRKAEEDMLSDRAVVVQVSDQVDEARIQRETAERLGLKFDEETVRVRADGLCDHIIGKAEEDMLSDRAVVVQVSDQVDEARIQRETAERLGFELKEETTPVRADRQRNHKIQESKILLILDDIWKDLDLAAVGIPCGNNHPGCKLLLMSRDMDLLKQMGSKTNFHVEILKEEEACNLFMKIAGVGEVQHDLRSLAIEVAKECGGLLVAISTIAKALQGKSENEWRIALRKQRNPPPFEDVEGAVVKEAYACIHLSYTNLESKELKSTFLLCSIMGCPKDASIEELLRYAVGLSLFNAEAENTLEDTRDQVKQLIRKLKDASLLLGTPNSETFSIHDVIHAVGRSIASSEQHKFVVINNYVPRSWAKDKLKNCTSITLHDIDELPKSLECPQLKFFYMKTKVRFTKVPDEFFKGMLNLEVLHFVEMDLSILPESLCLLRHLRTLNLDMCHVGDIVEIKGMENLEILVISSDDKFKQLSEKIGQLTSLRLLDLGESSFIIPPKTISRLTQLEELYLDDWYDQRQEEELNIETSVASLEELKDLPLLTALNIRVKDAAILPKGLDFFKKLERYKIVIGGYKWYMDRTSRTLQVTSDTNLCTEDGVIKQLKGIEDLLLDGEQRITNVLCELDGEGFPKLRHFCINNNPFILCVVDSMLPATCVAFPLLETLSLSNLVRLEKICHDQLRIKCFCQLRTIEVRNCHKLKNLFSFSIAEHLSVLQRIEVVDCSNMEEIFIVDRAYNRGIDPVFFEQVQSLTLIKLPRLRRIYSETEVTSTSQERRKPLTMNASSSEIVLEDQIDAVPLLGEKVVFPNLKYLVLHDIDSEMIWPNRLPSLSCWVQSLTRMYIRECSNLKYVFSSSTLGSFNHLQHLEISDCKELEEIIRIDDRCSNHVEFPSLEKLMRFKCFCQLRTIQVRNCHKLKNLFSFSIAEHLSVLQRIEVVDCSNMEEIFIVDRAYNGGIDPVFFEQLYSFTLRQLPRLKRICSETEVASTSQERRKPLTMNASSSEIVLEDQIDVVPLLAEKVLFPTSKYLELHDVNLESIWPNQLPLLSCWVQILTSMCIRECSNLKYVFSASTLGSFNHLQHLQISDCKDLEELIRIDDRCSNHVEFPSLEKLRIFKCPELREFVFSDKVSYPSLQEVDINSMENLRRIWQSQVIQSVQYCPKLCKVRLHDCQSLENIFPASIARKLEMLEVLDVGSCGIKEIVAEEGGVEKVAAKFSFPELTSLYLYSLEELSCFYPGKHTMEWPKLKELEVVDCEKVGLFNFQKHDVKGQLDDALSSVDQAFLHLEKVTTNMNHLRITCQSYLFPRLKFLEVERDESTILPYNILEKFHNLEELQLNFTQYEEIFSCEEIEKYVGIFAQLKKLCLCSLRDLKQIWKQESKMDLIIQKLEFLEVSICNNLINLMPPSAPFKNLKILKVYLCNRLKSLVPASTANSLMVLEEMCIYCCEEMTEIIENQGDVLEGKITLCKLKSLTLDRLTNLTSFCSGNSTFIFPLLENLTVDECPELKFFSSGALSTPNLQEVSQDGTNYKCEHLDLNTTFEEIHDKKIFSSEKLGFKSIKMRLQKFPERQKVFSNLEQLSFRKEEIGMLWQSQFPQQLFPKLKLLEVFEDESTVFPLAILQRFCSVKELRLYCSSYEEIFSCENFEKYTGASAQIKCLSLHGLDNLKQMWKPDSSMDLILPNIERLRVERCGSLVTLMPSSSSFRNLRWLTVEGCDGLMNLLAPTTAKGLVQLQSMVIKKCKTMTEVISSDEEAVTGDEIIFNKLCWLQLEDLSSLTSFCPRNYTFTFPDLRSIYLGKCPKMKFFSSGVVNAPSFKYVWHERTEYYCDDDLNATIQGIHEKLDAKTSPEDCAGPPTLPSSAS